MTTKTIGATARDYATTTLWEADVANVLGTSSLVTAGQVWRGEHYKDAEQVITGQIAIAGITADATHNVQLVCAAGQSFKDTGGVALAYSASNGVGIRTTTDNLGMMEITVPFTLVNGIQMHQNTADYDCQCLYVNSNDCEISQSIFRGGRDQAGGAAIRLGSGANNKLTNLLVIAQRQTDIAIFTDSPSSCVYTNLTIVKPSGVTTGGSGISLNYATPVIKGCAFFNFTTPIQTGGGSGPSAGSDYNATDAASVIGTHSLATRTYANEFQNPASDWRLKAGATLEAAAIQFTETGDVDIKGQPRSASTPDIGAWETQAGGGSPSIAPIVYHRQHH